MYGNGGYSGRNYGNNDVVERIEEDPEEFEQRGRGRRQRIKMGGQEFGNVEVFALFRTILFLCFCFLFFIIFIMFGLAGEGG